MRKKKQKEIQKNLALSTSAKFICLKCLFVILKAKILYYEIFSYKTFRTWQMSSFLPNRYLPNNMCCEKEKTLNEDFIWKLHNSLVRRTLKCFQHKRKKGGSQKEMKYVFETENLRTKCHELKDSSGKMLLNYKIIKLGNRAMFSIFFFGSSCFFPDMKTTCKLRE